MKVFTKLIFHCRFVFGLVNLPKVSLGDDASAIHVMEYLKRNGGISEELKSTLHDPVEVRVKKTVRKQVLQVGEGKASFEFTGGIEFICVFARGIAVSPTEWFLLQLF